MFRLTFAPFGSEKKQIIIKNEDQKEAVMRMIANNKIIQIKGEYYNTSHFESCLKIKDDKVLKLPEVELTEEERLKNCEKLREMKETFLITKK